MKSSLDKLAKNLSDKDFKYLSEVFSGKKLELVKKKGIYSYGYFNSFKRFKETNLPDIDKFFSSLKLLELIKKNIKEHVMFGKCLK